MRTLLGPRLGFAVTSLAMALTPALAQKTDRLPDADTPKVVRTIPITPSFDQRWFGPAQADRWISDQPPPSDKFTPWPPNQRVEAQNRSTGLPEAVGVVPVPGNRLRHDPISPQRAFPTPKAANDAVASALTEAIAASKPSIRRPDQATCLRHKLRTVWSGASWRCRK